MAKPKLLIAISARKNVVEWLDTLRKQSRSGIKQSAIAFFDQGNNYTTTAKVEMFNEVVEMLMDCFRKQDILFKETDRGYSITSKMLNQLKVTDLTDEFYDWVSDPALEEITYSDRNIAPILDKLYKQKTLPTEFKNIEYFGYFASAGNLEGIKWLLKTYGGKNYKFEYNIINGAFWDLVGNQTVNEDDVVDTFIKYEIFKNTEKYRAYPTPWKAAEALSEKSLAKVIPFTRIYTDSQASSLFGELASYHKINPKLLEYLTFTDDEWILMVEGCISRTSHMSFGGWSDYISTLMNISETFHNTILEKTDWENYDLLLELIPEIKELFIF